jgi:hypothetical protein
MSQSTIITIADAIVARITAAEMPMPITTVERRWDADVEMADVANIRVIVVPSALEDRTRLDRIRDVVNPVIMIAVMHKLDDLAKATVDAHADLAMAIATNLAGAPLANAADAKLISLRHDPLVNRTYLTTLRTFFSVILTTWQVAEEVR